MRNYILLFFFTFFGLLPLYAINTDSLQRELPKTKGLKRLELVNQLAWELKYSNVKLANKFVNEADSLLKTTNNKFQRMLFYRNKTALFILKADFNAALKTGLVGVEMARECGGDYHLGKILNITAIAYRELGRYREAISMQNEAIDAFSKIQDTVEIIGNLNNLALIYSRLGYITEKITIHQKVMDFELKRGDPNAISRSAANLAMAYIELEDWDLVEKYSRLAIDNAQKAKNLQFLASGYFGVGKAFEGRSNYKEALKWYSLSIDICRNNDFSEFLTSGLLSVRKIYEKLGDYNKAEAILREAIQLVYISGRLPVWVDTQVSLGELLINRKQYIKALPVIQAAEKVADSMRLFSSLRNIERLYAVVYDNLGDKTKALTHYKNYIHLDDSLAETGKLQMAKEIEMKYEIKGVNEANRLLKTKTELQRRIIVFQWWVVILAVLSVLGMLISIILLRRRRKQLQKANIILKSNAEELRRQTEELGALNRTKDKFFSIIAHDLKNPFNAIIGFSSLLSVDYKDYTDQERLEMVGEISKATQNAASLLDNLLQWARSQMGQIKSKPEMLQYGQIINDICTQLEYTAKAKQISFSCQIDENAIVFCDQGMLRFVIRNLVSNAIKFSWPKSVIVISDEITDEYHDISITDNGVGMSQQKIDLLFKIDEKVSTPGTEKEQGTGLGLLLSNEFMRLNDVQIIISSQEGRGSRFTLRYKRI